MLLLGDCLEQLKTLPDNSVDSVVTDPPAGIGFMGKDWDHHKGGRDQWIAWLASILKECNRVLKPGGHALVWSIPRTSHWTGMACEDAGFEVRDQISHLFGSGFPKSLNVSKAIDKEAGAEREVVGSHTKAGDIKSGRMHAGSNEVGTVTEIKHTAPATDLAKQWDGWGTSLKPSREDWWLVRKPISEKTVAANVTKHGTGALNIDGSRIESEADYHDLKVTQGGNRELNFGMKEREFIPAQGRWPSHTIFDEEASSGLGESARYFYCPKASKSERNKGCEGLPVITTRTGCGGEMPIDDNGKERDRFSKKAQNHHPTVKSIKLMEYLIKLITPPGGTVLDCFMGSGSTGVAAKNLGMDFIGIEQNEEYFEIAKKRVG